MKEHLGGLSISSKYCLPWQINDRYEFPLQLDLDREDGKYLSPDADRSVRNLYTLHRSAKLPCSLTKKNCFCIQSI
jgi:hypothetical protein